jgi:hypothetical protein
LPGNSVGASQQNFNLGFGATYSGQVFRTETVSFTLSLQDLKEWRLQGPGKTIFCAPVGSTDLQGSLDLKAWIDSALEPVSAGDLEAGIHPAPGSGAKPPAAGGGAARSETEEKGVPYFKEYAKNSASDAVKSAQQANATSRQAMIADFLGRKVKRKIAKFALEASNAAIYAHEAYDEAMNETSRERALVLARSAAENAEAASRYASAAKLLANPDPPIDSLSHALNFIVTVGAGISPNWALVHWKGPATLGNLVAFSGMRTHTLNIAMGSPAAAPSTDVARLLNNQAFRQAVQSP